MSKMPAKCLAILLWFSLICLSQSSSKTNQVWQGAPMSRANQRSVGTTDFSTATTTATAPAAAAAPSNTHTKQMNIHGVLCVVGWGILFPFGEYLRLLRCEISGTIISFAGYVIGLAGWGTGMKLGHDSPGIADATHRILGILIFCFVNVGWLSFCGIGISGSVATIVMSIVNIYRGFDMLQPDNHKWRNIYTWVLISFGGITAVLGVTIGIISLWFRLSDDYDIRSKTANGAAVQNNGSSV